MNKFAAFVFPDEKGAYEGLHAAQLRHAEGTLTVYRIGVVERGGRHPDPEAEQPRSHQIGVGALVGGLVGLFGGHRGAAVGAAVGGMAGGLRDEPHSIMSEEFLDWVE